MSGSTTMLAMSSTCRRKRVRHGPVSLTTLVRRPSFASAVASLPSGPTRPASRYPDGESDGDEEAAIAGRSGAPRHSQDASPDLCAGYGWSSGLRSRARPNPAFAQSRPRAGRVIPASVRMQVQTALGREALRIADRIHAQLEQYGHADASDWRALLEELYRTAGDALQSPIGMLIQMAILGRIRGDRNEQDDASERRPSPGAGFPGRGRRM